MMKIKKIIIASMISLLVLGSMSLAACGNQKKQISYQDGKYQATSLGKDPMEGYGKVDITVKDGVITEVEFATYDKADKLKDENYGINLAEPKYKVAQLSVATCQMYAEKLLEQQDIAEVDVISGATWNYDLFKDAVTEALKDAPVVNK